jgi:hypothetical protein
MVGVEQALEWSFTKAGLIVQPPVQKPCDHAYVFKIVRDYPVEDQAMTER